MDLVVSDLGNLTPGANKNAALLRRLWYGVPDINTKQNHFFFY